MLSVLSLMMAADALATIAEPLALARNAPRIVMVDAIREGTTLNVDELTADDVSEASAWVREVLDAGTSQLAVIDAAMVDMQCAWPIDRSPALLGLASLTDVLLVAAVVEAASGHAFLSGVQLSRAADLVRLSWRCDGAALDSLDVGFAALVRLQQVTSALSRAGWFDQAGATRAMAALVVPSPTDVLRCAGALATTAETNARQSRAREMQKTILALVATLRAAPESLPEGERLQRRDVAVACGAPDVQDRFLVSRGVLATLARRGADAILADSTVGIPLLSAQGVDGVPVVRAGRGAATCGLKDGDVVERVNGQRLDALLGAGARTSAPVVTAQREQRVLLQIRRSGERRTIELAPRDPTPGSATPR